jgi:glycosyltransferase involved in cell wall biosynthesis
MNILYLSPSNTIGGAEISLLNMVKYFKERGMGVYVALPNAENKNFESLLEPYIHGKVYVKSMVWSKPTKKIGKWNAVKQYLYASFKSRGWHIVPTFKILQYIVRNEIDLVHTNTVHSIDGAFAAKLAGIPHIQHIREVHGQNPCSIIKFPFQKKHPDLFKKWMDWLHSNIISNSNFTKEISSPYYPEKKLTTIYNPIEDKFFNRNVQYDVHSAKQVVRIGMVANVTSRIKNHSLFLEAAHAFVKRNPNIIVLFEIYGRLPKENDQYLANLKDKLRSLVLENVVFFKGQEPDALSLYHNIEILIHTFSCETFGRIYVEAMAQRVPVVALKGGGASELITDGETGLLVEEPDGALFAAKLEWLLSHPEERQIIIDNAYSFALRFRPEVVLPQIEQLYNEVLSDANNKKSKYLKD